MSTNGNATIAFRVADNGIGSFMDNIKRKSDQMTNDIIRSAQAQTSNAKEQTRIIQEQIRLIERKTAIEKATTIEQAKTSRENRLQRIDEYQYNQVKAIQEQMRNKTITNKEGRRQIEQIQGRTADMRDKVESNFSDKITAINASGREATLTNQLLRQNIDSARANSREQLNQMRRGDESIVNAVDDSALPLERFTNQAASQEFEDEKRDEKKQKEQEAGGKNQWLEFARSLAFERGTGLMAQIPGAKNELDFVKPLASLTGLLSGGLAGNLLDMANVKVFGNGLGNTNFGALGTTLGEKAGEFFGSAIERGWRARDQTTTQNFRVQALTGQNLGIEAFGVDGRMGGRGLSKEQAAGFKQDEENPQGFERYGLSFEQEAELMYQIAQRQGTSKNMRGGAENLIAAQQGIGVAQETSMALIELQRTSREDDRDFLRTLGGILQEGQKQLFAGDRAFLNEFVTRNYATLQRELLKTNTRVASGTTMDILQKADSIGGQWAARDPRSLGLIGQVNGALSNPQSDNMKALAISVMQQLHPGEGIFDIQRRIQHGLNEPGYAKGIKEALQNMSGGDENFAKMNFANAFGLRGDLDAALELYNNPAILGNMSRKTLAGTGEYGEAAIRQRGQEQTSVYTQSTAQIQNKFIGDVSSAVGFVGDKMKDLFGTMLNDLQDFISDKINGYHTNREPMKINKTYTPVGAYSRTNSKGETTVTVDGITGPAMPAALLKK